MRTTRLASLASILALCVAGASLYQSYRVQHDSRQLLDRTQSTLEEFQNAYNDQQTSQDAARDQIRKLRDETVRLEREMSLLRDVARHAPAPRDLTPVGPVPKAPAGKPEQLGGNVELKFGRQEAFLGVAPGPVAKHWAKELKYPHEFGLRVERVVADSAAEQAGLLKDDIMMKLNEKELHSTKDLEELMNGRRPGDVVAILVFREGKEVEAKVRLGHRKK